VGDLVIRNGTVVTPHGRFRYKLRGLVRTTFVRARIMVENRERVGVPGWGRDVPRGDSSFA